MMFAEGLAKDAEAGDVFCLLGELGAGKTAFAKGFARGLAITGHVNSPTFTIMQMYDSGRLPMYHFDLYRLMDFAELDAEALEDIGFFEYLDGDGVCLVEWAECAREFMPGDARWVEIRRAKDGSAADEREIYVRGLL